ncbi:MAG: hypothetical protein M1826_007548 [Phylliscum demangeonii]|nr:MAG: hypothetical protein M1826_007548 [Phylliscum demangeonii]
MEPHQASSERDQPLASAEMLVTTSLEMLENADQRKLMDVVDQLRRTGLGDVLQLPQLVVCGDQSSGKSSVLEAITEIPFPRKENLCTRFATEIVLRRGIGISVSTKITPDKNRPMQEQERLQEFSKSIQGFEELPELIAEATTLMGLDSVGGADAKAFAKDVLSIEICGPDCPHLTLVDLPGLIHAKNKLQSEQDIQFIRNLVNEYISNKRTIILAIISAKNDYANQIVLNDCRRVDPKGSRTLGIITKPDFLRAGSENENTWIDLLQNRDVYLELGWHMLKNREDDKLSATFEERNTSEQLFFSQGRYKEINQDLLGIRPLRTRLSRLLQVHLQRELPDLQAELQTKLREATDGLSRLGEKRSTVAEQKEYLMGVSMTIHEILKAAVQGNYEHPFFGPIDREVAVDKPANISRLRAVIQHLNLAFAKKMRLQGHKYAIGNAIPVVDVEPEDSDGVSKPPPVKEASISDDQQNSESDEPFDEEPSPTGFAPKRLSRAGALSWVLAVLQRTRGRELPGNFNPMLISQLFWEQSEPWEACALAHIDQVASVCDQFIHLVLQHSASSDVRSRLLTLKVEAALEESLSASREELRKIISDKRRHPITYNHYYTTTLQNNRRKKYGQSLMRISKTATVSVNEKTFMAGSGYTTKEYVDPQKLAQAVGKQIEQDMDRFSAAEALDSQIAYYKDELKYFVGAVTKQVIERHLIDPLPTKILSPLVIAGLTDDEVHWIAAEPTAIVQQRNFLETRKKILETGREVLQRAMRKIH